MHFILKKQSKCKLIYLEFRLPDLMSSPDSDIVLSTEHSYQSLATSYKDTETLRSHDRTNLQTEKFECVSLLLLIQRNKTPERDLR